MCLKHHLDTTVLLNVATSRLTIRYQIIRMIEVVVNDGRQVFDKHIGRQKEPVMV